MHIRSSLGFVLLILLATTYGCRSPRVTALDKLRQAAQSLQADRSAEPQDEIESLWLEGLELLDQAHPEPGPEREEVLNSLLLAITQHPAPAVRCGALSGLAGLALPDLEAQIREGLVFGLSDDNTTVRSVAAELALPALGSEVLPEYAVLISRKQSDRELLSALKALGPFADRLREEREVLQAVYGCIEHPDPGVSFHARGVLARMIGLPAESPGPADWWQVWWEREGPR